MISEISPLLMQADTAAAEYCQYNRQQVKKIVDAMVAVAIEHAEFYAKWSLEETGFGNFADNCTKYRNCPAGLLARYHCQDYIEPVIELDSNIIAFPKPAGVIVALIPSTNPIMTVYYKAIVAMMTRNTVIFSPHPSAKACSIHAVELLAKAAEQAGAPKNVIQTLALPGIEPLNQLMRSPKVNLILATGGKNRVLESYRSGTPSFGMGPGNVACYVHATADIDVVAAQTIASNSFDHALPCVCESVILADSAISQRLIDALGEHHGYFVTPEQARALREYLYPNGQMNGAAVGKSAVWIAEQAKITVPQDTKSLLVKLEQICAEEPLCQEKMFPVMGYMTVDNSADAIDKNLAMLNLAGKGHSAVIHCHDPVVVARFGVALPVCRIAVNICGVDGSSGVKTHLTQGPVVGTGFFGGSVIDDNVGPQYLIQWSRMAYPSDESLSEQQWTQALAQLSSVDS